MNWYPHHHPACFCWVCRKDKVGHSSDRCHCGRCLAEALGKLKAIGNIPPQCIEAGEWKRMVPHIESLQAAGYYVSPVGEIDGDVYVEVEEEAVEMWKELIGG